MTLQCKNEKCMNISSLENLYDRRVTAPKKNIRDINSKPQTHRF